MTGGGITVRTGLLGALLALSSCATTPQEGTLQPVDTIIEGGTVFDGSGNPGELVDVVVEDGVIVDIGPKVGALYSASRRISAADLVVAPGFIDPHTHAGIDLVADEAERRANLPFAYQGVTTVVVGNDGFGAHNIAEQAAQARARGIGTNVAYLVGLGPVRRAALGSENRSPSSEEMEQMQSQVRSAMCEGAWGFSAGLYYVPQNYADTEEVVALAQTVAELGGYYDTHMRDESTYNITVTGALRETLEIGRLAQIPVHIAHIKALGPAVWGHSAQMIDMIEAARADGMRVTADQYPWEASGTRISNALVPRAALEGGLGSLRLRLADPAQVADIRQGMIEGLARRGGADKLLITGQLHGSQVPVGITLAELADRMQLEPVDAAIAVLVEGDARVASFNMNPDDIAAFAAQEWVVTGSDGSSGHPRKYASFPKAYRDLVRGAGDMTLARFIQRSSGQTADIIGLKNRGYLRRGYAADILIFDPETFAPVANYQSPRDFSVGVEHLFVNGTVLIEDGSHTDALPGQPLLKDTQC